MTKPNRIRKHVVGILVTASVTLALAGAAEAVDLRDWGRKYENASERFVVLPSFNNEAVLDKETQLVWRRAPWGVARDWATAVSECYTLATGGRLGWRLPSISELASLTGATRTLPAGHPFQDLGAQEYFWSSTGSPYSAVPGAYSKQLLSTAFHLKNKGEVIRFLCVRGVGGPDR